MEQSRLQLFNTLTRKVEPFAPLFPENRDESGRPRVGMYCCGPTVYDYGHIGNFRTFVFADLVRRYLEFRGFNVKHVMNITDVEDKIIRRVRETGKPLQEFTGYYEAEFLKDLDTLGCLKPHHLPRATAYIEEIKRLIQRLIDRGLAYRAADGSVYFSIEKYRGCGCRYGQLVNLNFDAMRVGERVASDEYDKESLADFALWKARVPDDGDVFWPSPWGEGRPGWHIECSAMSMKLLGDSFDLHLGGEDLAFPHHEDEIAQSEGSGGLNGDILKNGTPFVKHWLHGAHLLVEGKKMSKSLGNYFTVRDLVDKKYTGPEIRFLLLSAHYRETFNFTLAGLDAARSSLARIEECLSKLCEFCDDTTGAILATPDFKLLQQFQSALDEDLNVSKARGVIFRWISGLNRLMKQGAISKIEAENALVTWEEVDKVFGLGLKPKSAFRMSAANPQIMPSGFLVNVGGDEDAPSEVKSLLSQRVEARLAKNFIQADAIRAMIEAKGWVVEDTPKGSKLKKL